MEKRTNCIEILMRGNKKFYFNKPAELGIQINSSSLPLYPETDKLAQQGLIPGGTYRNRKFRETMVEAGKSVPQ